MCLIVVKPRGKGLPSKKRMKEWFDVHPDGFGLAYPYGEGKVRIRKGAMTKTAMLKKVAKMKHDLQGVGVENVDVMFHFRQATDGEISPSNCHPFPLTKNQAELAATELDTKCALAHNGIIGGYSTTYYSAQYAYYSAPATGKTDTQEFIEDYLADLGETIHLPAVQALIRAYSESKFALMTPTGVEYIGKFIEEEGWCYSNNGYKVLFAPAYSAKPSFSSAESYSCPSCGQQVDKLYEIPNDLTPVCVDCFIYFEGRKPEEGEKMCDYRDSDDQWF